MKTILLLLTFTLSLASMLNAEDLSKQSENTESITLGGGCFWCVEAMYNRLEGVHSAISGYMGGHVKNPTYEQVCSEQSGHIEVVKVTYDPAVISTSEILKWFWKIHDPTTKDRQGNDVGSQYASAIFYSSLAQKNIAEQSITEAQKSFKNKIVTYLKAAETFYAAEDYHQDYYSLNKSKNPYCRYVITPKLEKLQLEN